MSNIVLYNQGDSVVIPQQGRDLSEHVLGITKLKAMLNWRAAVDLDIHAFYRLKDTSEDGHVYFLNKGKSNKPPHINLDKDAGVGNAGGDNQEAITIGSLAHVNCILIATNIFRFFGREDDNFARYDGTVRLATSRGDEVIVPLTSRKPGRWCVIALIDNTDAYAPMVYNINQVTNDEPKLDDYLDKQILPIAYED